MKKRLAPLSLILILAVMFISPPAGAKGKDRVITPGDLFPDFSFPMSLSRAEVDYLGLPTKMLGLMKGTTMLKGWRWAVVAIFTFMAFANPLPDPWSM